MAKGWVLVLSHTGLSKDKQNKFVVRCNSINDMSCAFQTHKPFPYCKIGQEVLREDLWCILECKYLLRAFLAAGAETGSL